jgi:hypothetical protein
VLSRPVDLLLVFDDSATVQNEMDMDMADMGQNYQVTTPRKKKTHITCVAPLLPKFDPKITVL